MPETAAETDKRDPRTYAIIGAAIDVHRQLGCGFLEGVYQEAKWQRLSSTYRADFICFSSAVVELKALPKLAGLEEAQILNYLKIAGLEIGLLLNFGTESLQYQRFVFSKGKSAPSA